MLVNKKRSYLKDFDLERITDIIWQQLEKLKTSNDTNIFQNIEDFLRFLDTPGVEKLFSEPAFSGYFQQMLINHSKLLSDMRTITYPLKPQRTLMPIQELKGFYQYLKTLKKKTLKKYRLTKEAQDLYFDAASHGSLLAAINLVNYHIFALQNKRMEALLPHAQDYEILINNLLIPLGSSTPAYLLAADLYYHLSGFLFWQDNKNLDSIYYMKLTLKSLMTADNIVTNSSNFIWNAYGEEFSDALRDRKVFLSEKSFLSIADYINYIYNNYITVTGIQIDFDEFTNELKPKKDIFFHELSESRSTVTKSEITESLKKTSILILFLPLVLTSTPFWAASSKRRKITLSESSPLIASTLSGSDLHYADKSDPY